MQEGEITMEIMQSARIFADSIKSTKEYNNLIQAKNAITKNNLLKNEVINFNKKLSNIYSSNKSQNAIKFDVEQLHKQFSTLTSNEEVKNFIKFSDSFNQMVYKTNQYIQELIQKDLILK